MSPSKTQPALLGGVAMGVLSALPVVQLGNCACCAWVIFGGALAAYLMQQNHPEPISAGDGAIVGLLSGIIGAVVLTVVSIPLASATSGFQAQFLEGLLSNSGDMPPEVRSMLESMRTSGMGAVSVVGVLIGFMFWLCIFSAFGLVGGILGALMFKKNVPPPPPPPAFTPGGFNPGTFTSHESHGGSHGGHTFKAPTFNPPPPPGGSSGGSGQ